jgi:hypothetical protein
MNGARWAVFEPRRLITALAQADVDFIVIGGYAAVLHGSPRITQDLDITYSTEPANLAALGGVLTALNARLYGIEEPVPFVPEARTLAQVGLLTLDTDAGKLDLLARPPGARSYSKLVDAAQVYEIDGIVVRIAGIRDLIAMKETAARPRDLADIAELEAIERLR